MRLLQGAHGTPLFEPLLPSPLVSFPQMVVPSRHLPLYRLPWMSFLALLFILRGLESSFPFLLRSRFSGCDLFSDRQTISFVEISIEAGILLGGKHEVCFVLGVAGIEPMPS
jgi:hypothetical protein